jgi:MoaA/NifB/PqqE/SkfB family radical SAM enzyme
VDDDGVALERVSSYLGGALGATYRRVVEAVAQRPLEAGVGLQTYASFRGERGVRRATAYLALEAYATEPPRATLASGGKPSLAAAEAPQRPEPPEVKPIGHDYHDRSTTELYYGLDARTGKRTCMAACEHCFLRGNPRASAFKQDVAEAAEIIAKLRARGYVVAPGLSESFAEDGAYLRSGILGDVRFVLWKMAWSSGMPLVKRDHMKLLQLAVDAGVEIVSMTSHGITDGESPFRGIIQPSTVREAVRRIQAFNAGRAAPLRVSLTFTIGRWNASPERLQAYLDYCEELGIDMLRLNNYCDHTLRHPELTLDDDAVVRVYAWLKELHGRHRGHVQLSVSEDFGFRGVEVMGFPAGVGDCAAGHTLFGVLYPEVHACPQLCNMPVGRVTPDGTIEWDDAKLALVHEAKRHADYGGCLAVTWANSRAVRELLRPVTEGNTVPAQNVVRRRA